MSPNLPELPDLTIYQEALAERVMHETLEGIRFANPFLLRTVDPPVAELLGRKVKAVERMGKRIVFALSGNYFVALHLMIAGRLHWKDASGAKLPGRIGLAGFDFPAGTLLLTEAGTKRRAALHLFRGRRALRLLDAGGVEPLTMTFSDFSAALKAENHTLKRTLTDPRIFAGIGNAYSDEILHAARLSPMALSQKLALEQAQLLYQAIRSTLTTWIERLRDQAGGSFPEKVTAFHSEMQVHGRFRKPCPICGAPIQRIVYAENECNYCPACQTGGRLLADRALSRLMHDDWPKTLDDLDERRSGKPAPSHLGTRHTKVTTDAPPTTKK